MNTFIKKIISEGKISIKDPSRDIGDSYLAKSEESLRSVRALIKIKSYNDAIALTYFSMYYSNLALLYLCGIKSENHTGSIILLKELFNIDNESISKAKKDRVDKQYYVDFQTNEKEVIEGIKSAEEFNILIKEKVARITQKEIINVREQIKKFLE